MGGEHRHGQESVLAVLDSEVTAPPAEPVPGFYLVRFRWGWEPAKLETGGRWMRCGWSRTITFGHEIVEVGPRIVQCDRVPA